MNKSDKYYLKKGKLELSMLDDEENDYAVESVGKNETKDLFNNLEFEHTKRLREIRKKTQQRPQQALKVSKDIYNTLHTMGQFLTKMEPQVPNTPAKKNMNAAKVQKLEQIASSIKVQEIEIPPVINREDRLNSLHISKADQIKEINEAVHIHSADRDQMEMEATQREVREVFSDTRRIDAAELQEMAINLDYRSQEVENEQMAEQLSEGQDGLDEEAKVKLDEALKRERDIEAQIESSYKQVSEMAISNNEAALSMEECLKIRPIDTDNYLNTLANELEERSALDQDNIDNILASFFQPKEPQYAFSRELKKHIERQIIAIKNYE